MNHTDTPAEKLTIFVMCHNRPDYAKLTIHSILRQTIRNFRLIISDNSSNDEVYRMVKAEFPGLEIRRRIPSVPSPDHFIQCISEIETDYFCLFHDDDLMHSDYVESMLKMIERHPSAVAYSCNAEIIDEHDVPYDESFESGDADLVIDTPRALAGRYFSRFPNGSAPFPAYFFRSDVASKIPIDPQTGGKYSDVTWLLEISKQGDFVWNPGKLIGYRIHSTSDGGTESIRDRLRLLGYFKTNISFVGQHIIDDYRFFLYKKLCNPGMTGRRLPENFNKNAKRYLLQYRFKRFLRRQTYAYLYYKIKMAFRRICMA